MGSEKVRLIKSDSDHQKAMRQLLNDMRAMELMLEEGMFDTGPTRIGAEQELSIVGEDWEPAPFAMEILADIGDPKFTTEFARFNLEINLDPLLFTGDAFSKLERQLWRLLTKGENAARKYKAHLLLTGILPTLSHPHLSLDYMTPLKRYEFLIEALRKERGGNFEFRIEGVDQWISRMGHSFIESCNTSFQVHYQVAPQDFVDKYNWAQLIIAPLMAATCNSPLLMGKRLWRETRIALFEQSTDLRNPELAYREAEPRVTFGNDWVRYSAMDLFRNNAFHHRILLAPNDEENSLKTLEQGKIPKLRALTTHNGTIYRWNRPCYGITDGKPHLRIENRNMPAGPTVLDEIANAAFWLGMMHGMPDNYRRLYEKLDFKLARRNFFHAANDGLTTHFYWPGTPGKVPAQQLILEELFPIARQGLEIANIDRADIDRLLSVIEERVKSGQTGAQWMVDAFERLQKQGTKEEALTALTAAISKRQQVGEPVHTWQLPDIIEAGDWEKRFFTVEQFMKTNLYTATPDDPVELVVRMMYYNNIRHVPVEKRDGTLQGIISARTLVRFYNNFSEKERKKMAAKDIMETNLVTVTPQTKTADAICLLRKHDIGCLPVVFNGKLVGIVTERDFVHIAAELLRQPECNSDEENAEVEKGLE
ncbi:MAG: glutamate-cysteine ligase family protein [Saprospiraceae bacterium]